MDKIDFKKQFKELYAPSAKAPAMVDVPARSYLMVDGKGDPNTSADFQEAVQTLYGVSYTIKFTLKFAGKGPEYSVPPLEGLWWREDVSFEACDPDMLLQDKDKFCWTIMIPQPEHITAATLQQALADLRKKGKDSPALGKLRLEKWKEGRAVQIMHVGPYSAEGPTVRRLADFAAQSGLRLTGRHHEIYMSDPRRTAPEKLKTIIRHAVEKA